MRFFLTNVRLRWSEWIERRRIERGQILLDELPEQIRVRWRVW